MCGNWHCCLDIWQLDIIGYNWIYGNWIYGNWYCYLDMWQLAARIFLASSVFVGDSTAPWKGEGPGLEIQAGIF